LDFDVYLFGGITFYCNTWLVPSQFFDTSLFAFCREQCKHEDGDNRINHKTCLFLGWGKMCMIKKEEYVFVGTQVKLK